MTDRADQDPYSRSEYRRLIAWEKRIAREAPLLERLLEEAPEQSVVDIGCGTGEHTAFFARRGARAVGIDRSPSMLERARDHERAGRGRFVELDARRLGALVGEPAKGGASETSGASEPGAAEPPFGLAICLGNFLPHITGGGDLDAVLDGFRAVLRPGGRLLLQLLNYRRLLEQDVRHLPLNFREGDREGEEIVFLRLLRADGTRRMLFFPTTLTLDPEDADAPVRVVQSRRVELRPWTDGDLLPRFAERGFAVELFGDMTGGAYEPQSSSDLVVIARLDTNLRALRST